MLESHVTLPWIDFCIVVKTRLVVTFQSGLSLSHHCVSHSSFAIEAEQYSTTLWWLCTVCIASPRASRHVIVFIFLAFVGQSWVYIISTHHIPFVKYKQVKKPAALPATPSSFPNSNISYKLYHIQSGKDKRCQPHFPHVDLVSHIFRIIIGQSFNNEAE